MGPKIEAAIRFASSAPDRQAFIVSLENAQKAFFRGKRHRYHGRMKNFNRRAPV
jgi:carbamate kinase